jgi:AcrR family transcriptional regulator
LDPTVKRRRRSAEEARRGILEAAEKQLAELGPDGVQVQEVARAVGIAPATVLHHFGTRDELLEELMAYGGKRLEERLAELVSQSEPNLVTLAEDLLDLYASRGYAALYAALSRPKGSRARRSRGVPFAALLRLFEEDRGLTTRRQREEVAFALLALNLVAFAEAHVGRPMRAAVGLSVDESGRIRFVRWLGRLLDRELEREP